MSKGEEKLVGTIEKRKKERKNLDLAKMSGFKYVQYFSKME